MTTPTEPVEAPTQPQGGAPTNPPTQEPAPDPNQVLNDMFRKGYGQAKDKFYTEGQGFAIQSIAQATGREFASTEDIVSFIKANPVAEVTEHSAYKTLSDKYKALQSDHEKVAGELTSLKLDGSLRKEVSEKLGDTKLVLQIDDAMTLFKNNHEISMEQQGLVLKKDGVQIFNEKQEPVTVGEQFVKYAHERGWIATNTEGSGGGSGAGTGVAVNPWATETYNLTEQGRISRENPALASQMKQEAEV